MKRQHATTKSCVHAGPYRVVQAVAGDCEGQIVVVCQGCGGWQGPWSHANPQWGSKKPTDPWFGTEPDLTAFRQDFACLLRSKPFIDHGMAHARAMILDRDLATRRMDGQWFARHVEIPPWQESKRHEISGDVMVRERAGWVPPASYQDPDDVYAEGAAKLAKNEGFLP